MEKHIYEDGSYSLESSSGAIFSNTTIENLDKLLTNTLFEKRHYLFQEWYDDTDVDELFEFLKLWIK